MDQITEHEPLMLCDDFMNLLSLNLPDFEKYLVQVVGVAPALYYPKRFSLIIALDYWRSVERNMHRNWLRMTRGKLDTPAIKQFDIARAHIAEIIEMAAAESIPLHDETEEPHV